MCRKILGQGESAQLWNKDPSLVASSDTRQEFNAREIQNGMAVEGLDVNSLQVFRAQFEPGRGFVQFQVRFDVGRLGGSVLALKFFSRLWRPFSSGENQRRISDPSFFRQVGFLGPVATVG